MRPSQWKAHLEHATLLDIVDLLHELAGELDLRDCGFVAGLVHQDAALLTKKIHDQGFRRRRASVTDDLPLIRTFGPRPPEVPS